MADDPQRTTTESSAREQLRFYTRKVQRHPAYRAWAQSVRTVRRAVPAAWRLATHQYRELPSVVIVGAQKAGTTQLYASLVKHPRCRGAVVKEVSYFSKHPEKSLAWYRSHFPWRKGTADASFHCLEASPSYLAVPRALWHLRATLPAARVIAILRDPVSRAFSHYQHNRTRRREDRSFAEIVDTAITQPTLPPEAGLVLRTDAEPMLDYIARGYYAQQLELLLHCFPREQVLILDSAELFADTGAACQRVFEFLDLEPWPIETTKVYNKGHYRERIDPAVAARLREHYRPYDELLVDLLGRRFAWMDSVAARANQAAA
jgi:hypothetical protein